MIPPPPLEIWIPFEPVFIKRLKSKYRESWSFSILSQKTALSQDDLTVDDSSEQQLFPTNPLHLDGFHFGGIESTYGVLSKHIAYITSYNK